MNRSLLFSFKKENFTCIMLIGLIGKPSSGKTTLFNAMCLTDAKMGNYPFTTINPNKGVAFVRVACPCKDLPDNCEPNDGFCLDGVRYVPVDVLDVAGLVPGAADGKGMGNKFLDDLRQANILIHVLDTSGTTDAEGNETKNYDPSIDIKWLNQEINLWISRLIFNDWDRFSKKLDADRSKLTYLINEKLSGLGSKLSLISAVLREENLSDITPREWTSENKINFVNNFQTKLFPVIIAANKIDRPSSDKILERLTDRFGIDIIGVSGLCELHLRRAAELNLIDYLPGSSNFKVLIEDSNNKNLKIAKAIKEKLLDLGKTTGVTELLEKSVFTVLEYIAVYPVEDSNKLIDKNGKLLPDVHLIKKGTNAKDLAGLVHSDLKDGFLHGILVNESNKRVSANYELKHEDILKIVSTK